MKSEIKTLVNRIFGEIPASERATELKEEIYQNLCDRYDELIKSGKSDYEAMEAVKGAVGDFTAVLDELNSEKSKGPGREGAAGAPASRGRDNFSGAPDKGRSSTGADQRGRGGRRNEAKIRRRRRRIALPLVLAGVILVFLLTAASALAYRAATGVDGYGLIFRYSYRDADKYIGGTSKDSLNHTVNYADINTEGVRRIDIDWLGGDVSVERGSGEGIHISESPGDLSAGLEFRYYVSDGVLYVRYSRPIKMWEYFWGVNIRKSLTITLPEDSDFKLDDIKIKSVSAGVRLDLPGLEGEAALSSASLESVSGNITLKALPDLTELYISTVSGDISCGRLGEAGNFVIKTVSGDVLIGGCERARGLSVKSVSGEVMIADCSSGDADIKSTSGNISYSGGGGNIVCKSVSGSVTLGISDASKIDVKTTSGDVRIALGDASGFSLDFDSVSGDYESRYPATSGGNRYYAGDGSCVIRVKTVSGDLLLSGK